MFTISIISSTFIALSKLVIINNKHTIILFISNINKKNSATNYDKCSQIKMPISLIYNN